MAARAPEAFFSDVLECAEDIERFVKGRTLEDFVADALLRAAVERKLQNIGEALVQLSRISEHHAQQFPRHRKLIGLRNVLVHGYSGLNNHELWAAMQLYLPELLETARRLAPPAEPPPR
jgi:uncharacterized protein with HEPN domain